MGFSGLDYGTMDVGSIMMADSYAWSINGKPTLLCVRRLSAHPFHLPIHLLNSLAFSLLMSTSSSIAGFRITLSLLLK